MYLKIPHGKKDEGSIVGAGDGRFSPCFSAHDIGFMIYASILLWFFITHESHDMGVTHRPNGQVLDFSIFLTDDMGIFGQI